MFHNVLMTTLTPMRDTNEIPSWNNRPFTTLWPEAKQEKLKDTNIKKTIKKKKRNRTMFTTEQVRVLEKVFARSKYIDIDRRREIAECLQIEQKCIKIWFQNRRMKEKKEISEGCDSTNESQVSNLEPMSPLTSEPNISDTDHKPSHMYSDVRPAQYYYNPNNYIKTDVHQNEPIKYETLPEYYYNNENYNSNVLGNHTDYTAQYYPPQTDLQYYYNTGDVSSQYATGNIRDWPANIFDTSYF